MSTEIRTGDFLFIFHARVSTSLPPVFEPYILATCVQTLHPCHLCSNLTSLPSVFKPYILAICVQTLHPCHLCSHLTSLPPVFEPYILATCVRTSHPCHLCSNLFRFANVQPAGRWSALHQAAEQGDVAAVSCLLANGARLDVTSKDGKTPLNVVGERRTRLPFTRSLLFLFSPIYSLRFPVS
jgi:hypothetical protein